MLTSFSFESLTRKVAQAYANLFLSAFPRSHRDHDPYLPMLVVDFCMLNVCSSVVWPCRVSAMCGKFAKILPALQLYRYQNCLPNKMKVIFSRSLLTCFSNLLTLVQFSLFLFFLVLDSTSVQMPCQPAHTSTGRSSPQIIVLAGLHFQKLEKNRRRRKI